MAGLPNQLVHACLSRWASYVYHPGWTQAEKDSKSTKQPACLAMRSFCHGANFYMSQGSLFSIEHYTEAFLKGNKWGGKGEPEELNQGQPKT